MAELVPGFDRVSALAAKRHPSLHTLADGSVFQGAGAKRATQPRSKGGAGVHATMAAMPTWLRCACLWLVCTGTLPAAKNLSIYFIDVEGGQATLFVAPGGESM